MSNDQNRQRPGAEAPAPRTGERPATANRRPWTTPRIVSEQTAFEHSILACTGAAPIAGARQGKGPCTAGGVNFS